MRIEPIRAFLQPEHLQWAGRLEPFCRQELDPFPTASDDDQARIQARELLHLLGAHGWLGTIADGDLRSLCLLREAVAARSPLADAVVALQALSATPLLLAADPKLRDAWVQPALEGAAMGAFAMTEPSAGSDVAALQTTAVRDGEEYVLDGTKSFISNAGIADFYVVFAKTDPEAGARGISCFVVAAATPGLRFLGPQRLSAPHPLGEIALEQCRVGTDRMVGDTGEGFRVGMRTLDRLRPSVGAAACGMAARALHEALTHARSREQFGRPLARFQLVQRKLAKMATELDAARLLVYRAAWSHDTGSEPVTRQAAMAKAFATEAAWRIVDQAVQILGGRGVLADSPVDYLYRAVRALRIYEGTTEIQQLVIARSLLRDFPPADTAGAE